MSKEAMTLARQIIWRYRHETPLGNQPHMIAHDADEAIERIDQALAKQEQGEPLCTAAMFDDAFLAKSGLDPKTPLYTTPQPAQKPLTDEQILRLLSRIDECAVRLPRGLREFARAIEAAHGIKENT